MADTLRNDQHLTDRFERALVYATQIHGGQVRKGTTVPYVAHLMAVSATVLEYGGDEDLAIAALLHDSVEDQGGPGRLRDVRSRRGVRLGNVCQTGSSPLHHDVSEVIRLRSFMLTNKPARCSLLQRTKGEIV